jgi:hypothetical protein
VARVTAFNPEPTKIWSQAWPALTGNKPLPDVRAGHAREKLKINPHAIALYAAQRTIALKKMMRYD